MGSKLGLFISSMPIDDAAKASMVQAALLMNEEELTEFVSMLETKYAEFKTQGVKDELVENLRGVKEKFDTKRAALTNETLAEMADLEKELDNL